MRRKRRCPPGKGGPNEQNRYMRIGQLGGGYPSNCAVKLVYKVRKLFLWYQVKESPQNGDFFARLNRLLHR